MLREVFQKNYVGFNKEFRFRGVEPGRLENFSDAVFALAITLLLISTSPPSNFEQIKKFAWEIIPFSLCIALILMIWHQHFVFFFRYGLRNPTVTVLNTIFLVIVLFYVYPLKYLFKGILIPISKIFNQEALGTEIKAMYSGGNIAELMIIYGLGATSVFLILTLMYAYALKSAADLQLDEIEIFDTRATMFANLLMGGIPLLSVLVALFVKANKTAGLLSGVTYFLYPVVMFIYWSISERKRSKLLQNISEPLTPPLYPEGESQ